MPATYILRCGDGSFHVGSTRDLARRMEQHHSSMGGDYTRKRQPVELVWFHEFDRIDEAYALEKRVPGVVACEAAGAHRGAVGGVARVQFSGAGSDVGRVSRRVRLRRALLNPLTRFRDASA